MDRQPNKPSSKKRTSFVKDKFTQTDLTLRDKYSSNPNDLLTIALHQWFTYVRYIEYDVKSLGVQLRKYFPRTDIFDQEILEKDDFWRYLSLNEINKMYVTKILELDGVEFPDFDPLEYCYLWRFEDFIADFKSNCVYMNSTLPQVYCEYKRNQKHFSFNIVQELKFWRSLKNGQPKNYDPSVYYMFLDTQKIPMCSILANNRISAQIGIDVNVTHNCPDIVKLLDSPIFSKLIMTAEMFSSESVLEKIKSRVVSISAMIYNLTRWTCNKMTTTDLIVNLAASLSICIPISLMTEAFKRLFGAQAQSGGPDIRLLIKAFFLGLFVLIIGKLPGKHTIDEFVNRVHKIPHAIDSLKKFWQQIDPVTQCAVNYIEGDLLGYDVLEENAVIDEVQKWADSVAEFSDLYKKRQIAKDKKTMLEAGRLHVTGIRLLAKCQRLHYGKENSELIKSLLATTYKISDIAIRSGADHSKPRREPLIVWFCGKSGVGKSTLTYPFICDMMKSEGPVPDNWVQKIYARAPECEFFDGDPSDWMVYDDGFQIRDSIANPSPELFEIIRLGNMFPYMYHKASIEEKGNSFADIKGIVISSNIEQIKGESLNCLDAVARRIKYAYKVQLKHEYRKYYTDTSNKRSYKLDKTKIDKPSMDIYYFQPFDPASGKHFGEPLTYQQVVTQCSIALHQLGDEFVNYEKWLEEYRQMSFRETVTAQAGEEHTLAYKQELVIKKIINGEILYKEDLLMLDFLCSSKKYQARFPSIDFTQIKSLISRTDLRVFTNPNTPPYSEEDWEEFYSELESCRFLSKTTKECNQVLIHPDYEYVPKFTTLNPLTLLWSNFMSARLRQILSDRQLDMKEEVIKKTWEDIKREWRSLRQNPIRSFGSACISDFRALTSLPYMAHQILEHRYKFQLLSSQGWLYRQGKSLSDDIVRFNGALEIHRTCYPYTQVGTLVEDLADEELDSMRNKIQAYKMRCKKIAKEAWQYTCSNFPNLLLYTVGAISATYSLYRLYSNYVVDDSEEEEECENPHPRPKSQVKSGSDGISKGKSNRARVQAKSGSDGPSKGLQRKARVQSQDEEQQLAEQFDLRPQWAKAQGSTVSAIDHQMYGILDSRIYANTLIMYLTKRDKDEVHRRIGHVVALRGSLFLMNYHFILVLKLYPECDVVVRQGNIVYHRCPAEELAQNYVRVKDRDLVVFQMKRKGIAFSDLVRHIQTKGMSYSHNVQTVMLARSRLSGFSVTPNPITSTDARLCTSLQSIELDLRGNVTEIVNAESWMYTGVTYNGDCGALLLLNNCRVPAKIVGVHNAFDAAGCIAISVPLYRDEVEEAMSYFDVNLQYGWQEDFPLNVKALNFDQGQNFNVVRCEKGILPSCSKSRLAPSPIYETLLPTLTKPGPLKPFEKDGKRIDPATLARQKWGDHLPIQDEALSNRVTNAVVQVFMRHHKPLCERYCYPLTTEEAIVGIPGIEGLGSINKVSSPGYPYILEKVPGRGKTGYFGPFDFDLSLPGAKQVLKDVAQMELDILNNRRPFVVWIDTLKDARIPIKKAEQGKTRIFSAGPMSYCILYRKYFLPPIAHCMWNRIDNNIAIGINPTSPEWHRLALKLKSKGKHCVAGDYAKFDGKAPTEGYLSALAFYKSWYMEHWDLVTYHSGNVIENFAMSREEFCDFLEKIFLEVVNHIHLMEHEIDGEKHHLFYSVCNGQPSGNPGTAFVNSAQGLWMQIRAWLELTKGTSYCTIEQFFDHVYMVDYGDDVVLNISDEAISFFNQNTLTKVMKQLFDIEFTDERKTGNDIPDSRSLAEVSFLKRGFVFCDEIQMYVCPMEEQVLLDILNWVRIGSEDPRVVTLDNMASVAAELALISAERFDYWIPRIKREYAKIAWKVDKDIYFDTRYGYLLAFRNANFKSVLLE